ncbi:hypothetical protein [Sphingomonas morindae]|uniref:Uncharacterized protein n=1 Tax=Sphingomonas morindae TaxID=1541170 RepID=A0ABY4X8W4_9SPHN|nr:hypothetical protein [Sphingomonas morindae]USI73377.1 hypothetical protein LHA26_02520 [Sphingomonas morindae]
MLKPLLRSVDRMAFEGPLALLLGIAAAFAVLAMPVTLVDRLGMGAVAAIARPLLALASGGALGGLAYLAMRRPRRRPAAAQDSLSWHEEEAEEPAEAPAYRVRRADAHPDAPPRAPIRASRDLGRPLPPAAPAPALVEEAEFEELREAPAAAAVVVDAAHADLPPAPAIVPAPAPAAERAGETAEIRAIIPRRAPAAAPRPSLADIVDRLELGVARRGGMAHGLSAAALDQGLGRERDLGEDLRAALTELNRLAARR